MFRRNRGKWVAYKSTMLGVKDVYENDFDPFTEKKLWKIRAWLIFSLPLLPIWVVLVGFPLIGAIWFRSVLFVPFMGVGFLLILIVAMTSPWWNRNN